MDIVGIDEVGRGCIGGSFFLVGCIIKSKFKDIIYKDDRIIDSKKHKEKKIEELVNYLVGLEDNEPKVIYNIQKFEAHKVDEIGLSNCYKEGLINIVNFFGENYKYILDGKTNYGFSLIDTQIKGDSIYKEIACASLIGKYAKNNESILLSRQYPLYGMEKHKGYVTKSHKEAIKKYGLAPFHRKTYKIKL